VRFLGVYAGYWCKRQKGANQMLASRDIQRW
jgi:hypothetical protein